MPRLLDSRALGRFSSRSSVLTHLLLPPGGAEDRGVQGLDSTACLRVLPEPRMAAGDRELNVDVGGADRCLDLQVDGKGGPRRARLLEGAGATETRARSVREGRTTARQIVDEHECLRGKAAGELGHAEERCSAAFVEEASRRGTRFLRPNEWRDQLLGPPRIPGPVGDHREVVATFAILGVARDIALEESASRTPGGHALPGPLRESCDDEHGQPRGDAPAHRHTRRREQHRGEVGE
jgi:hypothetical protein